MNEQHSRLLSSGLKNSCSPFLYNLRSSSCLQAGFSSLSLCFCSMIAQEGMRDGCSGGNERWRTFLVPFFRTLTVRTVTVRFTN